MWKCYTVFDKKFPLFFYWELKQRLCHALQKFFIEFRKPLPKMDKLNPAIGNAPKSGGIEQ